MSPRTNATISPDRAAGDPDLIVGMVVQSRSSSRAKRRQEEADTHDGTGPAAKVARLASAMSLASAMTDEETKGQEEDEAPDERIFLRTFGVMINARSKGLLKKSEIMASTLLRPKKTRSTYVC
jgi:hypothetical protein